MKPSYNGIKYSFQKFLSLYHFFVKSYFYGLVLPMLSEIHILTSWNIFGCIFFFYLSVLLPRLCSVKWHNLPHSPLIYQNMMIKCIGWFKLTITSHGGADPVSTRADAAVALHLCLGAVLIGLIFQSTFCNNTYTIPMLPHARRNKICAPKICKTFQNKLSKSKRRLWHWLPTLYYIFTSLKSVTSLRT